MPEGEGASAVAVGPNIFLAHELLTFPEAGRIFLGAGEKLDDEGLPRGASQCSLYGGRGVFGHGGGYAGEVLQLVGARVAVPGPAIVLGDAAGVLRNKVYSQLAVGVDAII